MYRGNLALLHKSYYAWSHLYSWDTQLRAPLANKDRSAELMVPIIEVVTSLQANYATMPKCLLDISAKLRVILCHFFNKRHAKIIIYLYNFGR